MPELQNKLVKVKDLGVVAFPAAMADEKICAAIREYKQGIATPVRQIRAPGAPAGNREQRSGIKPESAGAARPPEEERRRPETALIHESAEAAIPPAVERVAHELDVRFQQGAPLEGSHHEDVIASVGEHEPHVIQINDIARFQQGPKQTKGHEIIHLWRNNLPGPLLKMALPDDPKNPYDISKIEELRKKGYNLATIPQEQAATIVQAYIADPAQRKRLQIWIDDLNAIPLSTEKPLEAGQKGIRTTPRPPAPPIEAYVDLKSLRTEAARRRPEKRQPTAIRF